jgi:hypothetical protein
VTNGELTVGPVRTDLLLRGVEHGRVPEDCWVRESRWSEWRSLDQVREIRALKQGRSYGADRQTDYSVFLTGASDPSEVLLFSLSAAMSLTGATAGLTYRARRAFGPPVASYCQGPGMSEVLGLALDGSDAVLDIARRGRVLMGTPATGFAERQIAHRLSVGRAFAGVALVPIVSGRHLVAMMELGRVDHPFRDADALSLARLATSTVSSIQYFRG